MLYVYFFKEKTAYEMRIRDWSSDVGSSDLLLCGDEDFFAAIIIGGGCRDVSRIGRGCSCERVGAAVARHDTQPGVGRSPANGLIDRHRTLDCSDGLAPHSIGAAKNLHIGLRGELGHTRSCGMRRHDKRNGQRE